MSPAGAATDRGLRLQKNPNKHTPTLSVDKITFVEMVLYGCNDTINIAHPRAWILNGNVITNLSLSVESSWACWLYDCCDWICVSIEAFSASCTDLCHSGAKFNDLR